ncbi:MAG TPA: hypothetical protein VJ878_04815, partial [Candidatus Izemoplasmatales bacterium]|nr:hypothetical protein [Candidatus Izemoplasmatales bacterium]
MKRQIKILDKMVKDNSILVGLSLVLLGAFVAFLVNLFGLQTFLVSSTTYESYVAFLNAQNIDIFIII